MTLASIRRQFALVRNLRIQVSWRYLAIGIT